MAFDLVERLIGESGKLHFADRAQTVNGHTDRSPDDAGFCNGRVDDAVGTELIEQPFGDAEHAAVLSDVFPKQGHIVVFAHSLCEGEIQCFHHVDGCHETPISKCHVARFVDPF